MKKIIPFILASCACLLLAACGSEDSKTSVEETTEAVTETAATEATTAATTAATTVTTTTITTTAVKETTTEAVTEEPTEAETEPEEEVVEEVQAAGSFSASDLYAYYNGYSLTINQDMSTFLPASSVDSSPSCYYEGDDKIFHYGDMDVYTYPIGGVDYVLEISIFSSNVSTAKGLTVGMTLDDAIAMYGVGSDGGGMYSWYSGNTYMYVTTSGNVITSIGLALQN